MLIAHEAERLAREAQSLAHEALKHAHQARRLTFDAQIVVRRATAVRAPRANSRASPSGPRSPASGRYLFGDCAISVVESHQATKTSVPGTAVSIARSIGLAPGDVRSVRDAAIQRNQLRIPDDQLARHAYHQIKIEDGACSLHLESRVYGASPYGDGVSRIVEAAYRRDLEHRLYPVMEFVKKGWL